MQTAKMCSWLLLGMLCAGLTAGCAQSPPAVLEELPVHELTLSRIVPPRKPTEPQTYSPPAEEHWPAEGYRPWRYIVIHHSATAKGSAADFDKAHRQRGWDELGYHFVITNGQGGPDGHIEPSHRWRIQKWGAHCGGTPANEYNNYGIGICLVGDFTTGLPSPRQLASLRRLILYLMRTYRISPASIISHCDAPNASTACPGNQLYKYIEAEFRPELSRRLIARP